MMNLPNNDEFTPVYIAAKHGEVDIDKYLTDRYAATLSSLTIAAREGYECIISHLINVGSNARGCFAHQPASDVECIHIEIRQLEHQLISSRLANHLDIEIEEAFLHCVQSFHWPN